MIVSKSFLNQSLDALLTFNPICIYAETRLADLLERLYATGFYHWPVIDRERHVIGVVSGQDLIRVALEQRAATNTDEHQTNFQVPVSQFMKRSVTTLDASKSPAEALTTILKHGINSVPVTQDGKLWGMITTSDFVREFAYSSHHAREVRLKNLFDPTPLLVNADDSLNEVRRQFIESDAAYAVVMQGECPLGVVSARDLRRQKCRAVARSLFEVPGHGEHRATDVLKTTCHVTPNADLGTAATLMFEHQTQALMVCSRASELSGIITQEQILAQLLKADDEASETF